MRHGLVILATITFLALSSGKPPALAGFQPKLDYINLAGWSMAATALSVVAYFMYKNSPAQRVAGYEESLGLGEWYLAAHTGLSYLPDADWTVSKTDVGPPITGRTARNIVYQPGVQGGIKFGRFFDSLPWFGLETETTFGRNAIRGGQGRISPPLPLGQTNLFGGADWFMIWTMQVNFLARCGFFQDKEVRFGRLQPYVGIGPGFEVIYAKSDSAKNLALEALAGVRYMFTQKLALFCEYKFSYQFDVEYQNFLIGKTSPGSTATMTFDVPHHRFVLGVSYHFRNLYGN